MKKLETYIGYVDLDSNPQWFKKMCSNLFKIEYYSWIKRCQIYGWFHSKRLDKTINNLKKHNKKILKKYNNVEEFSQINFDMWKDRRGQTVPVLEFWSNDGKNKKH